MIVKLKNNKSEGDGDKGTGQRHLEEEDKNIRKKSSFVLSL